VEGPDTFNEHGKIQGQGFLQGRLGDNRFVSIIKEEAMRRLA